MEIISSYAVEISTKMTIALKNTCEIYREALTFVIPVINDHWNEISAIEGKNKAKDQSHYADALIHSTKNHKAVCDFDKQFYKLPSYFRRAVVQAALGCVRSYQSSHANWVSKGKQTKEPTLQTVRYVAPTFYKDNMFLENAPGKPHGLGPWDERALKLST